MEPVFKPIMIGPLTFAGPLGLGAGIVKSSHDAKPFLETDVCFLEVGSFTEENRSGNSGEVLFQNPLFSVNAMGLPGNGIQTCGDDITRTVQSFRQHGKQVLMSSAGMSPSGHLEICSFGAKHSPGIVVNLGCPNIYAESARKPVQSYDVDCIAKTLNLLSSLKADHGDKLTIFLKLSPFYFSDYRVESVLESMEDTLSEKGYGMEIDNPEFLQSWEIHDTVASLIIESGIVSGIITANTLGFVNITSKGGPVLNFNGGNHFGGLAGSIMKELGIIQVKAWRDRLPKDIAIIACGGITTGQDLSDYLDAGAVLGQVVSAYLERGYACFAEILAEYAMLKELV